MQYFFLEKANSLTQRWKLRQVAFDPKTRYLYYSSPLSRTEVEEAMRNGNHSEVKVSWRGRIKVTQLAYLADEYTFSPLSSDFNEKNLLTLNIRGYDRPLNYKRQTPSRGSSRLSWFSSSGRNSSVGTPRSDAPSIEPELPAKVIQTVSMVNATEEFFEAEEENLFRDVDLVPEDTEEEHSLEQSEEEESSAEDVIHTPNSPQNADVTDSFNSRAVMKEKEITLTLRAADYDTFRMVSLRIRQALVRHGLYGPLHKGLPPYDPRNGIAFATIPLHLRHVFRRLNDVVFYSFQSGHVVYLRNQREVRGLNGYLCITHDSVLQLQDDGKCPRWVDIEDIVGIDYVLQESHSFVCILSKSPYPDFLFVPTFPSYPLCSTFNAEEAVEGIVWMLRRLLMQRLRSGEMVSLALDKYENPKATAQEAEDVAVYDEMCHIRNVSDKYQDVFRYITYQGAGRPLEWRWDNSKTPTRFTYKLELAAALKREEENDSCPDDSEDEIHHEGVVPPQRAAMNYNGSLTGGSFGSTTTVTQLLAAPSQSAELRAIDRLRVTRADPLQRNRQSLAGPQDAKGGLGLPPKKPTSIGLVPSSKVATQSQPITPQVVPVDKGLKLRPLEDAELSQVSSNTTTEEDEEEDDDAFDSEDVDDLFDVVDGQNKNNQDDKDVQISAVNSDDEFH